MGKEINLLPQPAQKQRRWRLYLSHLGRFLNRVYLLLLLLIGVLVLILGVMESIKENVVRDDTLLLGFHSDVADEVRRVNQLVNQFEERQASYKAWTPQVLDVLTVAPATVRLTSLEVSESEPSVLSVRGLASSRSAVVEYQRQLEGPGWVKRVEAPLKNFALGPESSFSFRLHRQ